MRLRTVSNDLSAVYFRNHVEGWADKREFDFATFLLSRLLLASSPAPSDRSLSSFHDVLKYGTSMSILSLSNLKKIPTDRGERNKKKKKGEKNKNKTRLRYHECRKSCSSGAAPPPRAC